VLSPDVVPQNAGTCPILGCHNISEAMLLLQSPSYKCLDVYTEFGQLVCEIKEDQRGGTVSIGISTQYSLEVVYEVPFEWLQQVCDSLKISEPGR
jgi:hypothetical protein